MKWICALALVCAWAAPGPAENVIFKGTPLVQTVSTPDTTARHLLSETQRRELAVRITRESDAEDYKWDTRDGCKLDRVELGAYTHFFNAEMGSIKIGHMNLIPDFIQDVNFIPQWTQSHPYVYCEIVTQGMLVVTYWGVGDVLVEESKSVGMRK